MFRGSLFKFPPKRKTSMHSNHFWEGLGTFRRAHATRFATALSLVMGFALAGAVGQCAQSDAQIKELPAQLRPAAGQLRVSPTPVYLPTWLPAGCTGQLGIGEGPFKNGYEIWLGNCSADTTFFTSAGKGTPNRTRRTVRLKDGRTAYIQNLKDFCFDWAQGPYCYRLGMPGYGTKQHIATMVRIADSMKHLSPQSMSAEPKGDDGLAKAYQMVKDSELSDKRAKIGALYDKAVQCIAAGELEKAGSLIDTVAKSWANCSEMPPLAQVQMLHALVLKKLKNSSAAETLEAKYKGPAGELESKLKGEIETRKKEVAALINAGKNHTSEKDYLGKDRRKLADLLLAEGNFEDSQAMYKAAFADTASVYGKQHPEAASIMESYANLLKIWGKDPAQARLLLAPTGTGQ